MGPFAKFGAAIKNLSNPQFDPNATGFQAFRQKLAGMKEGMTPEQMQAERLRRWELAQEIGSAFETPTTERRSRPVQSRPQSPPLVSPGGPGVTYKPVGGNSTARRQLLVQLLMRR